MNCPICNINLVMADKQGIEIDYCPKCRGIWLDRGELEKIIERSLSAGFHAQPDFNDDPHDDLRHSDHDDNKYPGNHKHSRKRNFLSDMFDF